MLLLVVVVVVGMRSAVIILMIVVVIIVLIVYMVFLQLLLLLLLVLVLRPLLRVIAIWDEYWRCGGEWVVVRVVGGETNQSVMIIIMSIMVMEEMIW